MDLKKVHRISSDVLIIGGGVAAAMAAIEAAKYGVKVLLVDKGVLGRSGSTPTSAGAFSVVLPPDLGGDHRDSDRLHFEDLVGDRGGEYLNDQRLTQLYVDEGAEVFFTTERLGVAYRKNPDGKYYMFRSLGRSYPRVCLPVGSGFGMMDTLRKVVLHRKVQVLENIMITRLLTHQGNVVGAYGLHRFTGEAWVFQSKAVVLACGSATGLSRFRSSNFPTTGDAFNLSFEVGARLFNMEFIEFTLIPVPKGIPITVGGISPFPGLGARFYNTLGEHFLERYDPERQDRTARAKLVRAVQQEILEGRGPVLMDATMISREAIQTIPQLRNLILRLEALGVDYNKERFPWGPAIHTFLGGICVDEHGKTGINGLFACGEATGFAGIFGADRIGTAIAACQLFGLKAGKAAVQESLEMAEPFLPRSQIKAERSRLMALMSGRTESPQSLQRKAQRLTDETLFVIRSAKSLERALKGFGEIRSQIAKEGARVKNRKDLIQILEVQNLAHTGEIVATSALVRQESRGQHYREDFPHKDDRQWLKWIIVEKDAKTRFRLSFRPLPLSIYRLKPRGWEEKVEG